MKKQLLACIISCIIPGVTQASAHYYPLVTPHASAYRDRYRQTLHKSIAEISIVRQSLPENSPAAQSLTLKIKDARLDLRNSGLNERDDLLTKREAALKGLLQNMHTIQQDIHHTTSQAKTHLFLNGVLTGVGVCASTIALLFWWRKSSK